MEKLRQQSGDPGDLGGEGEELDPWDCPLPSGVYVCVELVAGIVIKSSSSRVRRIFDIF